MCKVTAMNEDSIVVRFGGKLHRYPGQGKGFSMNSVFDTQGKVGDIF